jgi:hypothetical protein
MVLGVEPLDKPIIPRRSFFDKGDFLALTGMFSLMLNCQVRSIMDTLSLEHEQANSLLMFYHYRALSARIPLLVELSFSVIL